MQSISRLLTLRYDVVSRRYIGEVAVVRPDGTEGTVRTSVVGHPGWPHERIARMLIGAARLQPV